MFKKACLAWLLVRVLIVAGRLPLLLAIGHGLLVRVRMLTTAVTTG